MTAPDNMSKPLAGDDRTERNRPWASMPHRRLISPTRFGVGRDLLSRFGDPVCATRVFTAVVAALILVGAFALWSPQAARGYP